jgi:hypothetical protein
MERGAGRHALKPPLYQAESAAVARERLEDFNRGPWGQKYPPSRKAGGAIGSR